MKKWRLISLVLALAMVFTFAAPALADGPNCIGGKCYAGGEVVAKVESIEIVVPEGNIYHHQGSVEIQLITTFDSSASAEAAAKAFLGITTADAYVYADGLVAGGVTGPNGEKLASVFYLEGNSGSDHDFDIGLFPSAYASANAEFAKTVVLTLKVPLIDVGPYVVDVYADTIANFYAESGWWLWWWGEHCRDYGFDFDWAEAYATFLVKYWHYSSTMLRFIGEKDCMIEITAYAAYPDRLGPIIRHFLFNLNEETGEYITDQVEIFGGVSYEVKAYCPDGRDVIHSATFHGRGDGPEQKIWYPFHNTPRSGPGARAGFYVTDGVE